MEGSGYGWACKLLLSVPGVRSGGSLFARMGSYAELACMRCDVDDIGRRRLRRDDRVRLQYDRVRQDHTGSLFRDRPWHGRGAGSDLRSIHDEDTRLPWRRRGGLHYPAVAHAALLPALWRSALGTGDQVSAALS